MKKIVALMFSIFLVACGTTGEPKEVLVPVPTPIQEPPEIENPFLPIWLLTDEDDENPDKVSRYYAKSVCLLMLQQTKLQCALDAYRIKSKHFCPITEKDKKKEFENCMGKLEEK